ncbi:hypothetical protein ENUP19_0018G0014 [Entamoeba nuttalli]|uniref:Palmitoyltransferase n=2 Tax=Entamoeba nuttalli TaxID=412467 RepID=K2H0B6_ENTNP|nr:DHHC zinc finger domain containing protein [Entamoeba nuttalli P19]EKE39642.1 DHHC zinc finger domain containing protein [Entamoeba nuttalli P19]|eukprot:XP_008858025.1 DHHC zinc finger domain containing protein [Entamoeba nuttalli P19]
MGEQPQQTNKHKDFLKVYFTSEQLKKIPVYIIFPLIGITYILIMTLIIFLLPKVYGDSSHYIFWLILGNIMYFLVTYNFYQCHYVTPECIPQQYYQINETEKEKYEYCDNCKMYKGDRVHHCSTSNKCIYRYDHYCGFIGNSLGFHNYRYFFLFLFYLWISMLIVDCHVYFLFTHVDISQLPYFVLVFISLFFGNLTFALTMEMGFIAITITFNYTSKELVETLATLVKEKRWTPNKHYKSILLNWKEAMQVSPSEPLFLGFLPTSPRFKDNKKL